MKKVLFSCLALLIYSFSFSQNTEDEMEILRDLEAAERKALVAENMMLNSEESKIFWPLYTAYRSHARELGIRSFAIIEKLAANYETLDNAKATEIMNEYFKLESEKIKLKNDHRLKMQKVLNAKLVMRYMQIENKIDAIIEYGLAAEIPLVIKD
ncbi:MAG: hypothetical protein RIC15_11795 [Vicingaceae bacterium]